MTVSFQQRSYTTTGCGDFIDVSEPVRETVAASGVRNGVAVVYSPHTTCAVLINEHEPGFLKDFCGLLDRLVPVAGAYVHDDRSLRSAENLAEDPHDVPNGHAHCRGALLGATSQAIPIMDGRLQLGRWQSVFLVELDRARERQLLLQVVGE